MIGAHFDSWASGHGRDGQRLGERRDDGRHAHLETVGAHPRAQFASACGVVEEEGCWVHAPTPKKFRRSGDNAVETEHEKLSAYFKH